MSIDDVKVVWGMVVTGATGVFLAIKWMWSERRKMLSLQVQPVVVDPGEPHFFNANHAMIKIYRQLSRLQFDTKAGKVVLCRAHNGGSIPTVKGPMFVSTLFDVSSDIAPGSGWERVKMDKQYHMMLEDLYLHKTLMVSTADADPGIFKFGMMTIDAQTCAFAEVLINAEEYMYIAAVFLAAPSDVDERVDYHLRIAATNLAKILKATPLVSEH